ncbi:MAG: orotidine-5'-phosphate decarboxylase [Cyclobacteriaceae bacterium]|jgi:orotidine-5'-phosphate decarboxylase
MTRSQIFHEIKQKESMLCVGLDPDMDKIPKHLLELEDPIFEFNKAIIDATLPYAIAYKPNVAFYESQGLAGWTALKKTADYLPDNVLKIADAKRGDIGNTSDHYAKAFFEQMNFDAITLAPYMGKDSIEPFLKHEMKWSIVLGSTSNQGFFDFQDLLIEGASEKLYETVLRKTSKWGTKHNMMYVVGATRAEKLLSIRRLVPEHFLLVPGIGAQGGDLAAVCKYGMNKQGGLIINSARSIIYASDKEDFAVAAGEAARQLQQQMAAAISKYHPW